MRDAADRQFRTDEALRNTERLAMSGQLAATMVHEVNNPLEAIGNLSRTCVENSTTVDEAQHFSRLASQEPGRISEIDINQDCPALSPACALASGYCRPVTDLAELASSALALFRGKLRDRHIDLGVDAPKTIAYCSAGEIRQAMVNLIGNALDAMPDMAGCCKYACPAYGRRECVMGGSRDRRLRQRHSL